MNDKIVMYDSDEAAQLKTVTGWVSRDGFFYGHGAEGERTARYSGCTHKACDRCGSPVEKNRINCNKCRALIYAEKFAKRPRKEWDGNGFIFSEATNRFYSDIGDAEGDLEEGQTLADLRLVICDPVHCRQFDTDDFVDELPEDGEPPSELEAAIDAFNKAVAGLVLSWRPGKFALLIEE